MNDGGEGSHATVFPPPAKDERERLGSAQRTVRGLHMKRELKIGGALSFSTLACALLALGAFAANSLLNRAALASGSIDPASFTTVRIVSGAALLAVLVLRGRTRAGAEGGIGGSWPGAFALVGYAALFSFAYVELTAATGALLLFGAVQCAMLTSSFLKRESLTSMQWLGFAVSAIGLVWLLLPGLEGPSFRPAASMLLAGLCWGAYSLLGIEGSSPLRSTAGNFLRAVPLVVLLAATTWTEHHVSKEGFTLAAISGAATSGLGYALWYRVLPSLGPFRAAVGQLAVPVLAALVGAILLAEQMTVRFLVSESMVLGGVALALVAGRRRAALETSPQNAEGAPSSDPPRP